MRKWFTTLILVGILGAIFTGTASARVFIPNVSQKLSVQSSDSAAVPGGGTVSLPGHVYTKGTQLAPAVGTPDSGPARHVQTSTSDNGFNWSNAGIVAGSVAGALCILAVCFVGIRRSRVTPAHA
jgi:hypothetical protein